MTQEIMRPKNVPPVLNPGFETDLSSWNSAGNLDAEAHSGSSSLLHGAGKLETTQTLTDVPNGWYTLRAWFMSSGKQKEAFIALKDCGSAEARASVPLDKGDWLHIVVSARVTNQALFDFQSRPLPAMNLFNQL